MTIDKPILFTKHFRDRMIMFKIQYWQLFYMLPLAEKSKKPETRESYKDNDGFVYYRYGTVIFTFCKITDKSERNLGECLLAITLTDQKIHLPYQAMTYQPMKQAKEQDETFTLRDYDYKTKY